MLPQNHNLWRGLSERDILTVHGCSYNTLLWPTRTKTLMHLSDLSWEFAVKFQIKSWVGMKEWMKRICPCFSLESYSRKALKKKYLFRISQSLKHYLLEVWITTGFTIQFDYDYHANDSIQFDITMYHNASRLYQIYLVHFFACFRVKPVLENLCMTPATVL